MPPSDRPAADADTPPDPREQAHFRRTLIRVMVVQAFALAALALLQYCYNL